ncbi:MAG: hypothetical protein Q9196_001092 [Gyalolechia fulgens]
MKGFNYDGVPPKSNWSTVYFQGAYPVSVHEKLGVFTAKVKEEVIARAARPSRVVQHQDSHGNAQEPNWQMRLERNFQATWQSLAINMEAEDDRRDRNVWSTLGESAEAGTIAKELQLRDSKSPGRRSHTPASARSATLSNIAIQINPTENVGGISRVIWVSRIMEETPSGTRPSMRLLLKLSINFSTKEAKVRNITLKKTALTFEF